jgi:hypothetical protein
VNAENPLTEPVSRSDRVYQARDDGQTEHNGVPGGDQILLYARNDDPCAQRSQQQDRSPEPGGIFPKLNLPKHVLQQILRNEGHRWHDDP